MALIDDIIAATDKASVAAVTAANAAIDKVNATRVAIADAVADAGTAAAVKAHISGEDVAALGHIAVPTIDKPVTPVTGPSAQVGHS